MARKAWRYETFESNSELIAKFCDKYGFKYKFLNNGYQIRIETVLDIYPVRARWHWLPTDERGQFETEDDLKQIILKRLDPTIKTPQTIPAQREPDGRYSIKHAFLGTPTMEEVLTTCGKKPQAVYPIMGLGSNDKIYRYENGGWVEEL